MKNNLDTEFCSLLARKELDPIVGSIGYKPAQIYIEVDEPWERQVRKSADFPGRLGDLSKIFKDKFSLALGFTGISSEKKVKDKNFRRMIFVIKNPKNLSAFDQCEWLIPSDKTEEMFGLLSRITYLDQIKDIARHWQVAGDSQKHFLICCHGERDECCGKFGLKLYEKLISSESLDSSAWMIWKCSHLGGHRYAPTAIELPSMRAWGHLNLEKSLEILLRNKPVTNLEKNYRGFAGLISPFEQVAEWEAFKEIDWKWLKQNDFMISSQWNKDHEANTAQGEVSFSSEELNKKFSIRIKKSGTKKVLASCHDTKMKDKDEFLVLSS